MSTMISFKDNNLSEKFLTKEELAVKCPMAFKEVPTNPNVSDRYVQANTMKVVEDLGKLGWFPVEAKQCRNKRNSKGIRSYHMIAFQNPTMSIPKANSSDTSEVDVYPRIILTNSHDGFNSFKFMLGLFRLVCSNGLVVCDNQIVNMSIRHINYTFEELRTIVTQALNEVSNIRENIIKMRNIELQEEDKREIAKEVVRIRKGVEDVDVDDDTIDEILTPIREEDKSNDLWTVFNVCQEKLIKGGFLSMGKNNKKRKVKSITSIKKDVEYNQKLWSVASNYLTLA